MFSHSLPSFLDGDIYVLSTLEYDLLLCEQ